MFVAAPGILPPATLEHPCSSYAVMSNHLRVVVQVIPEATASWSADEVAKRWTRLYPRENQDSATRAQALAGNVERIEELRKRLADLSWHASPCRAHRTPSQPRRRL